MVKPILKKISRSLQKKTGLMDLRIKRLRALKRNPKRLKRLDQIHYDKAETEINKISADTWAQFATGKFKSPLMTIDAMRNANKNIKDALDFEARAKKRQALLKRQRKRI